MEGVLW